MTALPGNFQRNPFADVIDVDVIEENCRNCDRPAPVPFYDHGRRFCSEQCKDDWEEHVE